VGAGVAFTAAAGVVLCMVRFAGGGLLAPAMAHTATNSLGAAASWVALRHAGPAASGYKGPDGR
jgi:membrane protease YdiL (CAAX protease family)